MILISKPPFLEDVQLIKVPSQKLLRPKIKLAMVSSVTLWCIRRNMTSYKSFQGRGIGKMEDNLTSADPLCKQLMEDTG